MWGSEKERNFTENCQDLCNSVIFLNLKRASACACALLDSGFTP